MSASKRKYSRVKRGGVYLGKRNKYNGFSMAYLGKRSMRRIKKKRSTRRLKRKRSTMKK